MPVTLHRNTITIPRPDEAVEAIHSLVAASSVVDPNGITSSSYVYLHEYPESPASRFAVVRRLVPFDAVTDSTGGVIVIIQVMLAMLPQAGEDARLWLSEAHDRIHQAVAGQRLSLANSTSALPVEWYSEPSTPEYDDSDGRYYSTAEYRVVLLPQ